MRRGISRSANARVRRRWRTGLRREGCSHRPAATVRPGDRGPRATRPPRRAPSGRLGRPTGPALLRVRSRRSDPSQSAKERTVRRRSSRLNSPTAVTDRALSCAGHIGLTFPGALHSPESGAADGRRHRQRQRDARAVLPPTPGCRPKFSVAGGAGQVDRNLPLDQGPAPGPGEIPAAGRQQRPLQHGHIHLGGAVRQGIGDPGGNPSLPALRPGAAARAGKLRG